MQKNILGLLTMTLGLALLASAQVKTEVPPVEPGAKPVNVEQIKGCEQESIMDLGFWGILDF
jgi:hypothetical protein